MRARSAQPASGRAGVQAQVCLTLGPAQDPGTEKLAASTDRGRGSVRHRGPKVSSVPWNDVASKVEGLGLPQPTWTSTGVCSSALGLMALSGPWGARPGWTHDSSTVLPASEESLPKRPPGSPLHNPTQPSSAWLLCPPNKQHIPDGV